MIVSDGGLAGSCIEKHRGVVGELEGSKIRYADAEKARQILDRVIFMCHHDPRTMGLQVD